MAIFKNKKRSNSRYIKIFGRVVYMASIRMYTKKQWFLGGLFSVFKTCEFDHNITKKYYFLKRLILKEDINSYKRSFYLNNKLVYTKDLTKSFIRKYNKYFKSYDNVLILNANSGEIYLFLTYVLKAFLRKHNAQKVLFMTNKQYHIDLIEMICPEIPHCKVKKLPVFNDKFVEIANKRFYMLFTKEHFLRVEEAIKKNTLGSVHYFEMLLKELDMDSAEIEYTPMQISNNVMETLLKKIKKTGLNLDNFIFITPEAYSCEECSDVFWKNIILKEKLKGYDVYVNITDPDNNIENIEYKTCKLSFAEAIALAGMSKKIISLRSGLTECLLQTRVPMVVLYTPFKDRYQFNGMEIDYVMSGFGLKLLPNIGCKYVEIALGETSTDKLLLNSEIEV
jgi:hypothetical protein